MQEIDLIEKYEAAKPIDCHENLILQDWINNKFLQIKTSLVGRDPENLIKKYRSLPYDHLPPYEQISIDVVINTLSIHRLNRETRDLLLSVGKNLLEENGSSEGNMTLTELPESRNDISRLTIDEQDNIAKKVLSPNEYKGKFMDAPNQVKIEILSLYLARSRAQKNIISQTAPLVTTDDISLYESMQEKLTSINKNEKNSNTQFSVNNGEDIYITTDDLMVRPEDILKETETTDQTLMTLAQLPIQPLHIPEYHEQSNSELPEFIWNKILYSSLFVDRNGREVTMDPATNSNYIHLIKRYIDSGFPIEASEYTPLISIPNPLKRTTQNVAMAELDFFRRLAQVTKCTELYYPPGLVWHVINEVPAFLKEFGISEEYANYFHNQCQQIVDAINESYGKTVLVLWRMDDFLWGSKERQSDWISYRNRKEREMRETLIDFDSSEKNKLEEEIRTFIYPMATCINPLTLSANENLNPEEIIEVYENLKNTTGSNMRGVGMGNSAGKELSLEQMALLEQLRFVGYNLSFNYRLTMGSREVLPAFEPINKTVKYTMVTKPNKPILYPNSRRGPSFPAHGEPIVIPDDKGWSTVTVKPWISILANRTKYKNIPVISENTGELLYFRSAN